MSKRAKILVGVIAGVLFIALVALMVWFLQPGPAISVQMGPLPGRSGAMVTVVGQRFPANKDIYVGLASPGMPPTAGTSFVTAVADRDGKFTVAFPYPVDSTWAKLAEVTVFAGTPEGDAVATARALLSSIAWLLTPTGVAATLPPTSTAPAATATTVIVSPATPVPTITLQTASGIPGSTIIVTGRGWRASESLTLSLLGPRAQVDVTTNANAQGSFATTINLPTGWGEPTATVLAYSLDGALQATAIYRVVLPAPIFSLTIVKAGNGAVTNAPADINCGATCSANFNQGTRVMLNAGAEVGYTFAGWSGGICTGTGGCAVTMDGNKTITATFTQNAYTLSINVVGQGTITKSPDQATYTQGQVVTLIATPATDWIFSEWSGVCTGTGSCTVTMNGAKSVQAKFTKFQRTLNAIVVGGGSVTKNPNQSTYDDGSSVKLTATPADASWAFSGWTGDLTGTANPATLLMNGDKSVMATFTKIQRTLNVTVVGSGSVAKNPNQSTFDNGSSVQLTATPVDASWEFSDWSGDLITTTNPATLLMNGNKTVVATFKKK